MTNEEAKELLADIKGNIIVRVYSQYVEAIHLAIKALEQQPCEDCISRQAVLDIIDFEDEWLYDANSHNANTKIAFSGLKSSVKDLSSATPPRPKGKWIGEESLDGSIRYMCDNCKEFEYVDYYNYCPNCGANMREGEK